MFREMRLKENALPEDEAIKMLIDNTNGVLAVHGDEGYPYAVPLSYVYLHNKIYFHCATSGHKLDAIKNDEKVSFCVVEQDQIIPEEFNTLYRSVIVFGKARILTGDQEKRQALEAILQKYSPKFMDSGKKYIDSALDQCIAVEISIEHLTGKAGK